jgi:hypothetical protein
MPGVDTEGVSGGPVSCRDVIYRVPARDEGRRQGEPSPDKCEFVLSLLCLFNLLPYLSMHLGIDRVKG